MFSSDLDEPVRAIDDDLIDEVPKGEIGALLEALARVDAADPSDESSSA